MARIPYLSLKLAFLVTGIAFNALACKAQTDRSLQPASQQPNQSAGVLPTRTLPQAGVVQLQQRAPVLVSPVIQHTYISVPVITYPVIVHPIISPANSGIASAPIIVAPVIDYNAPIAPEAPPELTAPPSPVAATPQMFGLLTLPLLPITTPGKPHPAGPTVLADLTKASSRKTDMAASTGSFGPLALSDLSKPTVPSAADSQIKPDAISLVNGVLRLPTLTYVLLGLGQPGINKPPVAAPEPGPTQYAPTPPR